MLHRQERRSSFIGQACSSIYQNQGDKATEDCEDWCDESKLGQCRYCKCRGCKHCHLSADDWALETDETTQCTPFGLCTNGSLTYRYPLCLSVWKGEIHEGAPLVWSRCRSDQYENQQFRRVHPVSLDPLAGASPAHASGLAGASPASRPSEDFVLQLGASRSSSSTSPVEPLCLAVPMPISLLTRDLSSLRPRGAMRRSQHDASTGTPDCEPCFQFRSKGMLVRAFECEGNWSSLPNASTVLEDDTTLHLPIERYGPGHASSFYPPAYGAPLLAMASANASDSRVQQFRNCARAETSPALLRDGPWVGSAGPRPTSVLRAGSINVEYATYANSFGFVLRGSTHVIGAHAFDAWTTSTRPKCKDESQQAALRFQAVQQFCYNASFEVASATRWPGGDSKAEKWPPHIALHRALSKSAANCSFKTVPSMLRQQERFRALLHDDAGLLERCPFARYAGAISQVASVYDVSDVSGIFVFDWIPSHLPLAKLAFERLPQQLDHQLQLVRFSRQRGGSDDGTDNTQGTIPREQYPGDNTQGTANTQAPNRGDKITCSCHRLHWPERSRRMPADTS